MTDVYFTKVLAAGAEVAGENRGGPAAFFQGFHRPRAEGEREDKRVPDRSRAEGEEEDKHVSRSCFPCFGKKGQR